jgi:hypothetical protein
MNRGERWKAHEMLSEYADWRTHGGFEPAFSEIAGDRVWRDLLCDFRHKFGVYVGSFL